jgi:peptidyl-tRNA hydrolase, PTH1 family
MKYLIAGLGNIGPEYELTRHNIGFLVLDRLADKNQIKFDSSRYAFISELKYKGRSINLIKPTTYMNLSGKAVNYWMKELKVPIENVLIITDDIALPFAKLRLRAKGSSGGHNGLESIQEALGTDAYVRLRVGVGSEFSKGRQVDYVLSNFSKEELNELPFVMDKAVEGILSFCTVGLERTMNIVNTK